MCFQSNLTCWNSVPCLCRPVQLAKDKLNHLYVSSVSTMAWSLYLWSVIWSYLLVEPSCNLVSDVLWLFFSDHRHHDFDIMPKWLLQYHVVLHPYHVVLHYCYGGSSLSRVHPSHVKWCVSIWHPLSILLCELCSVLHTWIDLNAHPRFVLYSIQLTNVTLCHCLLHPVAIIGSIVGS